MVDFGAFVDIGIHEDGLIHISKLSNSYVKHPSQVVSVGDLVTVWVDKLDIEREKFNLSLVAPRESIYLCQISLFGRFRQRISTYGFLD